MGVLLIHGGGGAYSRCGGGLNRRYTVGIALNTTPGFYLFLEVKSGVQFEGEGFSRAFFIGIYTVGRNSPHLPTTLFAKNIFRELFSSLGDFSR